MPIIVIHQIILVLTFWTRGGKTKFENIFHNAMDKSSGEWIWTCKSSNVNNFPPFLYFLAQKWI